MARLLAIEEVAKHLGLTVDEWRLLSAAQQQKLGGRAAKEIYKQEARSNTKAGA